MSIGQNYFYWSLQKKSCPNFPWELFLFSLIQTFIMFANLFALYKYESVYFQRCKFNFKKICTKCSNCENSLSLISDYLNLHLLLSYPGLQSSVGDSGLRGRGFNSCEIMGGANTLRCNLNEGQGKYRQPNRVHLLNICKHCYLENF